MDGQVVSGGIKRGLWLSFNHAINLATNLA